MIQEIDVGTGITERTKFNIPISNSNNNEDDDEKIDLSEQIRTGIFSKTYKTKRSGGINENKAFSENMEIFLKEIDFSENLLNSLVHSNFYTKMRSKKKSDLNEKRKNKNLSCFGQINPFFNHENLKKIKHSTFNLNKNRYAKIF